LPENTEGPPAPLPAPEGPPLPSPQAGEVAGGEPWSTMAPPEGLPGAVTGPLGSPVPPPGSSLDGPAGPAGPPAPRVCMRCGAISTSGGAQCVACGAPLAGADSLAPGVGPEVAIPRPYSFMEALDTAFRIYRRHFVSLVGCYALFGVPAGSAAVLALMLFTQAMPQFFLSQQALEGRMDPSNPFAMFDVTNTAALAGAGVLGLVSLGLFLVSGWFKTASLIVAIQGLLGRTVTVREAVQQAKPFMWQALGYLFLSSLMTGLGVYCCVLPSLWLTVALSLGLPAMVVERSGTIGSMDRSFRLAHADFWPLCGRVLLLAVMKAVIVQAPQVLILFPTQLLSWESTAAVQIWGSAVTQVADIALTPLVLAGAAVFYFDQRCRVEALDLVSAFRSVRARSSEQPAP